MGTLVVIGGTIICAKENGFNINNSVENACGQFGPLLCTFGGGYLFGASIVFKNDIENLKNKLTNQEKTSIKNEYIETLNNPKSRILKKIKK